MKKRILFVAFSIALFSLFNSNTTLANPHGGAPHMNQSAPMMNHHMPPMRNGFHSGVRIMYHNDCGYYNYYNCNHYRHRCCYGCDDFMHNGLNIGINFRL